ncbi:hypothetical protein GPECTOR_18g16 [Gonium pectorale]|uniref:Peptidase C1A papain C-terminal domain-containing protein n=1 Tax=Gonium pectorale TaxID=33097 RepID=A0A150GJZ2_GONPE|nr:hypothetical protein GPECTOR_18g16 [Gonium pectorale]|eukprot:KXZ50005.1 hypothetical protein GPECTOR_18g16 [Gonium pectorale]
MAPLFSVMDGSASDVLSCDGIYVAMHGRTLAGLLPPASVSPSSRVNTEQQYRNMRAAAAAAERVAKQLQSQNKDPRRASSLSPGDLRKAFTAANVPLAQEDKAVGSYTFSQVLAALDYPAWDARRGGIGDTGYSYVSPVKDQGGCGTCVAFAAAAIAEIAVAVANDTIINKNDFSEQWIFFCNRLYEPSCSIGWYMSQAKEHIRRWGAVTTFFAVYNDFFFWAPPTPYKWDRFSWLAGYHQVAVIGYNDTGQYWIAKNSWGPDWGDKGFVYISYDAELGRRGLQASSCGDGWCGTGETCSNCAKDCGACSVCGDGVCSGAETCRSCLADCGVVGRNGARYCCGDGVCSSAAGENSTLCAADCPTTACNNNRVCNYEAGERCVGPDSPGGGCADCGVCSASGPHCGDGVCSFRRKGYSESCFSCPMDCARCLDEYFCGDGLCSSDLGESAATCSRDCGTWRFPPVAPGTSLADENGGGGGGVGRRRTMRESPLRSFWG